MAKKLLVAAKLKLPNRVGGGAKTNLNGLLFEQTTSLHTIFEKLPGFKVNGDKVFKGKKEVALLCGKHKIYNNILRPIGIDYKDYISKKLVPDEAILIADTIYIIEKKFQGGSGSVDEKLQTCDFKKKQYTKLFASAGIKVEYIYVLNDWFKHPSYKDVHDYILNVGCRFYFNEIPLVSLGL